MFKFPTPTHPSLAALPPDNEFRKVYPIDVYPEPQAVKLPLGETTYWLLGPQDGPKLVLIHGISTPAIAFREIAPVLVELGFYVLIYDLYGRGYTEAPADPAISYDVNLYITQLALLLQHVGFDKIDLVGYSMGGGIAAAFAATFPNLLKGKIALIACTGLMDPSPGGLVFPPPESFEGGNVPITALPPSLHSPMTRFQLQYLPGYYKAMTSSIVSGPLRELNHAFEAIAARKDVKAMLIHGTNDTVVSLPCAQRIKDIITSAELAIIDGAGHNLVSSENSGYNEFKELLVGFMRA